jgi:hypothetical protein
MKLLAESWVAESWGKQSFQEKERALKMHRTGNVKSEGSMLKVRCSSAPLFGGRRTEERLKAEG